MQIKALLAFTVGKLVLKNERMILQFFLSLIILLCGVACFFVPRNTLIGFKTKHSYASNEIWKRSNRLAGVLFIVLGIVLMCAAKYEIPRNTFFHILLAGMIALVVFSSVYAFKLYRILPSDEPITKYVAPRKKEINLTFSKERRSSIFFATLCLALIGVSYFWMLDCFGFFPEKLFILNPDGSKEMMKGTKDDYIFLMQIVFFADLLVGALIFIATANIYKRNPTHIKPYSFKQPMSNLFFACIAMMSLLIADINYVFLKSTLMAYPDSESTLTMTMPLLGIFVVWFAIFKKEARLR